VHNKDVAALLLEELRAVTPRQGAFVRRAGELLLLDDGLGDDTIDFDLEVADSGPRVQREDILGFNREGLKVRVYLLHDGARAQVDDVRVDRHGVERDAGARLLGARSSYKGVGGNAAVGGAGAQD